MKTEKKKLMDDKGVSEIIGILLVFGIIVLFLGVVNSKFVPQWNKEIESGHFNTINSDILNLRQAIEETAIYDIQRTSVIHASLDYPNRIFLNNPPKPGATISTYNNRQIKIEYNGSNEMYNDSCTIKIKENYNYFSAPELIMEHGMIIGETGKNNYTIDDPLMNNKTINLFLVKCDNNSIGTTSSINLRLYPGQISDLSVNNANITFTTDYSNRWREYLTLINVSILPPLPLSPKEITMYYNNPTRIRIYTTRIII
jgi:hypothetical protein